MYAIILAAGMGTRLGAALPKPLTEIAPGLSLLGNLVTILARLVPLRDLHVVVGHQAPAIVRALPNLQYVMNGEFPRTNTARSLLLGLRAVRGADDVLWINGDLYLDFQIAHRLVWSDTQHSRALVSQGRTGPEAMKYSLRPDGGIARLSKTAADSPGESLGLHVVVKRDRPVLHEALLQAGPNDYYEAALERCTLAGTIRIMPIEAGQGFCREVDDPEDLDAVRAHMAGTIRAKTSGLMSGQVRGPIQGKIQGSDR